MPVPGFVLNCYVIVMNTGTSMFMIYVTNPGIGLAPDLPFFAREGRVNPTM